MILSKYLEGLDSPGDNAASQTTWYEKLNHKVSEGQALFQKADALGKSALLEEFRNRVRTEEIKAWYGAPEGESLFQGTSISSLTIPAEFTSPLKCDTILELEEAIADSYIRLHEKNAPKVRKAIIEDVEDWIHSGLYYGVVIASKVISQAFNLAVSREKVVFKVGDYLVDPHEITSYPHEVRQEYFQQVIEKIDCFGQMGLRREEVESSLILADISKPHLEKYKSQIFLAPIRCNEIAAVMARRVKRLIREKTSDKINIKSLEIVIYDTDTPYTYHHLLGGNNNPLSPALPGLIVLGSSGTIDAFRWLYAYRASLIAQKIQKSSLYSEVHRKFIPFVFFGVLVPRDAEILLEMANLDRLRYRGNISPQIEFCYLLPTIADYLQQTSENHFSEELNERLK
ncbi:MAG: hypothetical protein JRF49_12180 [Deltaproteobacteria bacterium]|nr:hypothetical protein [Deltaproteobacteria bacterium]